MSKPYSEIGTVPGTYRIIDVYCLKEISQFKTFPQILKFLVRSEVPENLNTDSSILSGRGGLSNPDPDMIHI